MSRVGVFHTTSFYQTDGQAVPSHNALSTSYNTHLQHTFLLSSASNRYLWPQPVGTLVPVGGTQPNLRPSSVTESCAAREQLEKQMPSFSESVKDWHCHVSKHALFSFYRNSRKRSSAPAVIYVSNAVPAHASTPLPGLGVYTQKA